MRASFTALSLLAVATSTLAQVPGFDVITSPEAGAPYKVGDSIPILWTPGTTTGTVTLTLIGGTSSAALAPILTVVAGINSQTGAYQWTIPANVGNWASYGFNLTSDADPNTTFQYSNAFTITGGGAASSPSPSPSSSPSSSAESTPSPTPIPSTSSSLIATSIPRPTSTSCTGVVTGPAAPSYAFETRPAVSNSTIASIPTASATIISTTPSVPVTNGTATGGPIPVATASGAGKMAVGSLAVLSGFVFALFL